MRPGRRAYLWAVAVFLLTGVPSAFVLYDGITGITEGLLRAVGPGETLLTFDEAGTYTVFHESPSEFQGETFPSNVPSNAIQVSLGSGPGEFQTMGSSVGDYTYNLPGRSGVSIGSLHVDQPGEYRVVVDIASSRPDQRAVVALGHEKGRATLRTVFGGIGLGASGLIAFVIAIVVLILRVRAKNRIEAARLGQA